MTRYLLILGIVCTLVGASAWLADGTAGTTTPPSLLILPESQPAPADLDAGQTEPALPPPPATGGCPNGQCSIGSSRPVLRGVVGGVTAADGSVRLVVAPYAAARFNAPVGRPLLRIVTAPRRVIQAIRARRAGR